MKNREAGVVLEGACSALVEFYSQVCHVVCLGLRCVMYRKKAAAYVQFFNFWVRLLFEGGLYAKS